MKKAISLLVAIATTCALSVAAFAADDIPGTLNNNGNITMSADSFNARVAQAGPENTTVVGKGELFLADGNKIVGVYDKLDPDQEYKFKIYWNNTDAPLNPAAIEGGVQLTGALLKGGNVRLRTVKGSSSIQSARIVTSGRGDTATYELVINTRASYGTKLNEVEYKLDVTGSTETNFLPSTHIFEVGYENIGDSETDIGEGGYITISNDAPVITKDQFTAIAKSVNYKTVNFEGEDGGWKYVNRVSGMPDSNFYYTYDAITDLINKYPDQEYKFLSFKSGVTFPSTGEMRIDVSDIYDSFGKMHTYLYRNGKLTRIDSTYDSGANEMVFRTNYLGSFVITDKAITDTSIINEGSESEPEEDLIEGGTNQGQGNEAGSGNPNTGASSAMNVAITLGLVSLVTAGAMTRKKK